MTTTAQTAHQEVESELIRRAQAGDQDAFGELVRGNYERVFRTIVGIIRDEHEARDACQDVWIAVWKKLATFRGDSQFSTWLHPIAVRRALDHLRKRKKWLHRFLPFLEGDGAIGTTEPEVSHEPDPREETERGEKKERFKRALDSLPEKHRTVLVLREVEGLSYEQIAKSIDCRVGTVMSRLFNARRLLAQKLENSP